MNERAERDRAPRVAGAESLSGSNPPRPVRVDSDALPDLERARLFLDADAPSDAHRILEFLLAGETTSATTGDPPTEPSPSLPSDDLLSAILTLAHACRSLGHATHLARLDALLAEALARDGDRVAPEIRAQAICERARNQHYRGNYQESLAMLRGVPRSDVAALSGKAAVAFLGMEAQCLARLGRYDEAETVLARSLGPAETSGDQALAGDVRRRMASVLRLRGRIREATELFRQAAIHHRSGGDFRGAVIDLIQQASSLQRMGVVAESRQTFLRAVQLAASIGDAPLTINAEIGVGMTAITLGEFTAAREGLLRCWLGARRQGRRRESTLALEFLAEAAILTERLSQARIALRLCRRHWERSAPRGDLAGECLIREAWLHAARGQWLDCTRLAEEALSICRSVGMLWEEALALRTLAIAQVELGDRPKALETMSASFQAFENASDRLEARLSRDWMEWLRGAPAPRPPFHPGLRQVQAGPTPAEPETPPAIHGPTSVIAARAKSDRRTPSLHPAWSKHGLVTNDDALRRVLREAELMAASGCNFLILGETGTGKEIVAHAVHELSNRNGPFVAFNCAALPAGLAESELFGAARGAFTGADRSRRGLIQDADGGTLFLDEVGDFEPSSQGSLLRFLDCGEVRPLGSSQTIRVKCGVVAATLRPLHEDVRAGRFRGDLYYRLAQGVIALPPLRARLDDLPCLIPALWQRITGDRPVPGWLTDDDALQALHEHTWPGNVRELFHLLRRLAAMDGDFPGTPTALRGLLAGAPNPQARPMPDWQLPEERRADRPTIEQIRAAIREAGGSRDHAAERLGISRSTLYRILRSDSQI